MTPMVRTMSNLVKVTLMTGEHAYLNMDNVDVILPAHDEDKETRPEVNSYVSVGKGTNVINLKETPDELVNLPTI